MPLPERVQERIDAHAWPKQVGETKVVFPHNRFGRGVIARDFQYPDGKIIMDFQSWDATAPKMGGFYFLTTLYNKDFATGTIPLLFLLRSQLLEYRFSNWGDF